MSDLDSVLQKIQAGVRVRIVQDRYGQERVEMKRAWLPLTTRIDLPRQDLMKVKDALGARNRKHRPAATVTI